MCGFVGWSLRPGVQREPAQLRAMLAAIAHRGPDDRGELFAAEHGLGLCHARLSVIDLSTAGRQPMVDGERRHALAYNGELYNFRRLRAELERMGRSFSTRTDSEVVMTALTAWGPAALDRFRGMFALASWDAGSETLLLARDPLGMKPLYYTELPGQQGVVFASELKAFLALPDFAPRVRASSLQQFLELGYTYEPEATILEGVHKLAPGHFAQVRHGRLERPIAYYDPVPLAAAASAVRLSPRQLDDKLDELQALMDEVVDEHLVADVPLALLLSGGLDSSLVAGIAARSHRLTTVTMRFASSTVDETPAARRVAEALGTEHHEITVDPRATADGLQDVTRYFDDLFADWGLVSTRLLYQRCRDQGIKVVLVGEGSDELFGGYDSFRLAADQRWSWPRRLAALPFYRRYSGRRYGKQLGLFSEIFGRYVDRTGDLFQAVRLFEVRHQLPNNYVMKVDKASSSVGVEARAPFLDRRIADLALSLPREALLSTTDSKLILRRLAARLTNLPAEVAERPKFGAAIATTWMDESPEFRSFAREEILRRDSWTEVLGLHRAMVDYFDHGRSGYHFPSPLSLLRNLAWRLLLLNLWSRHYVAAGELA